ncbi:hypothetical protein Tco_0116627 [Tanacetum coccineum]
MTLASSACKQSKSFDELMSTSIDFSACIMSGPKITNLTQETLLGPAFRLLKGNRSNYVELDIENVHQKLGYSEASRRSSTGSRKLPEEDQRHQAKNYQIQNQEKGYELYKFSDRTLNRLQTSLDDITKNIRIEYLPKRRWSSLEKKRANIMIKTIDNQTEYRGLPRDIPLDSVEVLRDYTHFYRLSHSELVGIEKGGNQLQPLITKIEVSTSNSTAVDSYKDGVERRSIKLIPYEVLKLKNIKKDGYTRFQHQEQYEHVGPEVTRSQEGKISQDDDKRLCLVDDLKEVLNHILINWHFKSKGMDKATISQHLVTKINFNPPSQILNARAEAIKKENVENKNRHGIDKESKAHSDETLCIEKWN